MPANKTDYHWTNSRHISLINLPRIENTGDKFLYFDKRNLSIVLVYTFGLSSQMI